MQAIYFSCHYKKFFWMVVSKLGIAPNLLDGVFCSAERASFFECHNDKASPRRAQRPQRGRAATKTSLSLSVSSAPQEISHRAHRAAQWTLCEILSCRRGHGEEPSRRYRPIPARRYEPTWKGAPNSSDGKLPHDIILLLEGCGPGIPRAACNFKPLGESWRKTHGSE
jgi:hypothetical protein